MPIITEQNDLIYQLGVLLATAISNAGDWR
jgi:hypothetical protein